MNTTLSPLTDEDREYLTAQGYDPDAYMLLDLTVLENSYYNATATKNYSIPLVPGSDSSIYYYYMTTQILTKSELVCGSLIRVKTGYRYRPVGWEDYPNQSTSAQPDRVTAELTLVDETWWGDYNYRALNLESTTSFSAGTKIYKEEADNFRIYVPIVKRSELTEEDREYLTSLGLNPDEYKVLTPTYTLHGFYNSTGGSNMTTTGTYAPQYYCTNELFTRYDLTLGSVIRLTSGYKYRPEGWVALDEVNTSATRPGNVSDTCVTVDNAWWADWNYRAFSVQKGGAEITEADMTALRIYVKIS